MRTMLLALLILLTAGASPAAAAGLRIQDLLVCETFAQAKRFVELGADKAAIEAVNKEAGADACIAIRVAFVARGPVARVRHGFDTFIIVEVIIYGMNDGKQIQRLLAPVRWYALAQPGQDT